MNATDPATHRASGRADDLVDRYVAVVTRALPAGQRDDVAAELRGSILDSTEDRAATSGPDRSGVVHAVLTDLGDPADLARGYRSEERHLIGPAYFDAWWQALRGIWVTVVPLVTVIAVAADVWLDGADAADALGSGIATALTVSVHVCFWVTGTFWLLERTDTPPTADGSPWTPSDLPPLPRRRSLGISELVWGSGILAATLVWLAWQHLASPLEEPLLDPGLWSSGWGWALVGTLVIGIAVEVVKFAAGRWTLVVTALSVAVDVALAGLVVALVSIRPLVNPIWDREAPVDAAVVIVVLAVGALGVVDAVRHHLRDTQAGLVRASSSATAAIPAATSAYDVESGESPSRRPPGSR